MLPSNAVPADGLPLAAVLPLRPRSRASHPPIPSEIVLDFSTPEQQARRPSTRRCHAKSRLGCLTCKRRRVKCDEARPVCTQCTRLQLSCAYSLASNTQQEQNETGEASQPRIHPSIGTALSMEDLKFYDHFIQAAHPLTPIQGSDGYLRCTAMSRELDYLAHSLLALAATHLTIHTNADYTRQALRHRGIALRLVQQRLSAPVETAAEADALMASTCCLTAETALDVDTMTDYLSIARGSYIINQAFVLPLNKNSRNRSVFSTITIEMQASKLMAAIEDQTKDLDVITDFSEAVRSLRPICQTEAELQYQHGLWRSITVLPSSSLEAVKWYVFIYIMPYNLKNEDFLDLVRKDNMAARLLVAHMLMLDYLLGQTCIPINKAPKFGGRKVAVLGWVKRFASNLPAEYRAFGEFPLRFCKMMETCDARYMFFP